MSLSVTTSPGESWVLSPNMKRSPSPGSPSPPVEGIPLSPNSRGDLGPSGSEPWVINPSRSPASPSPLELGLGESPVDWVLKPSRSFEEKSLSRSSPPPEEPPKDESPTRSSCPVPARPMRLAGAGSFPQPPPSPDSPSGSDRNGFSEERVFTDFFGERKVTKVRQPIRCKMWEHKSRMRDSFLAGFVLLWWAVGRRCVGHGAFLASSNAPHLSMRRQGIRSLILEDTEELKSLASGVGSIEPGEAGMFSVGRKAPAVTAHQRNRPSGLATIGEEVRARKLPPPAPSPPPLPEDKEVSGDVEEAGVAGPLSRGPGSSLKTLLAAADASRDPMIDPRVTGQSIGRRDTAPARSLVDAGAQ